MKQKTKKAVILVEQLLVFIMLGVLSTLVVFGFRNITTKTGDYLKLKNGYMSLKQNVNNITSNSAYYSAKGDLSDLSEASIGYDTLEADAGLSSEVMSGESKFRQILMMEMGLMKLDTDMYNCKVKQGETVILVKDSSELSSSVCYVSDNGVVFGIPNTDFKKSNLALVKNAKGERTRYLPITMYPDVKKLDKSDAYEKYSFIVGLRADGAITVINDVDCEKYPDSFQCNSDKILTDIRTNN